MRKAEAMRLLSCLAIVAMVLAASGCGAGGSELTKEEEYRLRHPDKKISPEEAKAMAKYMGAGMAAAKKQQKAAAVGPDGVPLDKSKWNKATASTGGN